MSLGTLIDPIHTDHLGLNLINVFRKLRQRVIWKWKKEFFHDVPKNVLIGEWFPQIDILSKIFFVNYYFCMLCNIFFKLYF